MTLNIFFSNSLDIHYEQLKKRLFVHGASPFHRRLVIVYGPAMQSWLMLKMAQDPQLMVATGIEFIYLNDAFEHLLKMVDPQNPIHFPSMLELALGIEQELRCILKNNESEKQQWDFLLNYLKIDISKNGFKLTPKMEKRIVGLSMHMAALFRDYGRYGKPVLEQWKNKSLDWQGHLWNSLFNALTNWNTEVTALGNPIMDFDSNCEVHFFSVSFISKCEFEFLNRLSKQAPVHYYLLSPCAVFWSDIRSDKESTRLYSLWSQKEKALASQAIELEEYLSDRNALLANFGRLGREMATQIELSEAVTSALYVLPSSVNEIDEDSSFHDDIVFEDTNAPLTLLQAVQADMLLLRNPVGQLVCDLANDDSIQLHQAPTRRREVQILYNNLLRIIEKHPEITPSDVIVMAPQIADYVPYIRAYFGSANSQLDCQILDLGLQNQNEIVQGFLQLLALCDSRWDVTDLLQLFENKAFQRRHKITTGDYFVLQNWIKKAGIYWGDDLDHRDDLLRRRHCQSGMVAEAHVGTWDFGLTRLMLGLTTILEESHEFPLDVVPCENIDFSQMDLLSKWLSLIHSLRDDIAPLHDATKMTMQDWSKYLSCLLESYFQPDYDVSESVQDYEEIKKQFGILQQATNAFREAQYPFYSVKMHLENLLKHCGMTFRENYLQSVRFCSLMPLRSIPAKVIVFLGMEEGAFPRQNQYSSLNLMSGNGDCDHCPFPTDYDRYLFLEALHSAKNYLLFSYQGFSTKDQKELQPSLLITELFSYLNHFYTIETKSIEASCQFKHPFDAFDKRYFNDDATLKNYSLLDYQAALTLYQAEKKPSHTFVTDFIPRGTTLPSNEEIKIIDLKQLTALARNPIKFYLNHALEIYLQRPEDREIKSEEELILSPLTNYQMKEFFFKESVDSILQHTEKAGQLPLGVFKDIASQKFKSDMDALEAGLRKHQIEKNDIFQIELSQNCKQPTQLKEGQWMLPAIQLESNGIKRVIVGKLPLVSSQGLIALSTGHVTEIWKLWPQYLLYHCAARNCPMPLQRQIIPLEAANSKQVTLEDPIPYLNAFVDYYDTCHAQISPLMPSWIPHIAKQDAAGLRKEIEKSLEGYEQEVRWILNKDRLPDPEKLIQDWKPQLDQLAGCLFTSYDKCPKL